VKGKRIKTDWAALSQTHDGRTIVCIEREQNQHCVIFKCLDHLKNAIESKLISVKKWAVAVPKSSCIFKTIVLPTTDMTEAVKMVEFELPSLIPLPTDQVSYGCTLLQKQETCLKLLVHISKISKLEEHLQPLRSLGIEPQFIIPDVLAIHTWFNMDGKQGSDNRLSILATNTQIVITTSIDGCFQHAYELASPRKDDDGTWHSTVQHGLAQYNELLSSAGKTGVISVAGVPECRDDLNLILCDIPNGCTETDTWIEKPLPQVTAFPEDNVHGGYSDVTYEAVLVAGLLRFAEQPTRQHTNLVPIKYTRKLKHKMFLNNIIVTAILGSLLILSLWLSLLSINLRLEKRCKKIESKIAPIEHIASSVDSKRGQLKAALNQLANRGQITQIIKELYQYTPKSIHISELRCISVPDGTNVEIKGQADVLSGAFEYVNVMGNAELLKPIQITKAQQIPRPGGSIVEFQATCDINTE